VALLRRRRFELDVSEHDRQIGWSREQLTGKTLVAARYDIVTAGENRVTVVASGVAAGLAGSHKRVARVS
jgi:hypothetical protein